MRHLMSKLVLHPRGLIFDFVDYTNLVFKFQIGITLIEVIR